mmetsp:Transcript_71355/g.190552  ORF Transcript_71355/g.190552 Transcript_71355/m.190552 type:complete len:212 (-) Transcript_71355:92-727(-)
MVDAVRLQDRHTAISLGNGTLAIIAIRILARSSANTPLYRGMVVFGVKVAGKLSHTLIDGTIALRGSIGIGKSERDPSVNIGRPPISSDASSVNVLTIASRAMARVRAKHILALDAGGLLVHAIRILENLLLVVSGGRQRRLGSRAVGQPVSRNGRQRSRLAKASSLTKVALDLRLGNSHSLFCSVNINILKKNRLSADGVPRSQNDKDGS